MSKWISLLQKLKDEGYSYDEVLSLRAYYKEQILNACNKERASGKELNLGKSIWQDCVVSDEERIPENKISRETEKDKKNQPVR